MQNFQALGDQEPLSASGDEVQSLHANNRSHWLGPWHGELGLADEAWAEPP